VNDGAVSGKMRVVIYPLQKGRERGVSLPQLLYPQVVVKKLFVSECSVTAKSATPKEEQAEQARCRSALESNLPIPLQLASSVSICVSTSNGSTNKVHSSGIPNVDAVH
jgi:hypothetical protein